MRGHTATAPVSVNSRQWLTTVCSLAVGTAFFALWFWLEQPLYSTYLRVKFPSEIHQKRLGLRSEKEAPERTVVSPLSMQCWQNTRHVSGSYATAVLLRQASQIGPKRL
jgi:hypothetical protein